jgi:hypothetical protein
MTAPQVLIFLDLDGVIADFDTHKKSKLKSDGKTDYDALDYAWWTTMPVFKGAKDFYYELRKQGQVRFLTGPVPLVDCFAGKAAWINKKFIPERGRWGLNDLIICHSKAKQLMAGPGRILVDDDKGNIARWNEAGGIGILHEGDYADTLKRVKKAVAGFAPKGPKPRAPGL